MRSVLDIWKYFAAATLVGFSLFITANIPLFAHQTMFLSYNAVIISAFFLGTGPSILAAMLAIGGNDYFFLPPIHQLNVGTLDVLDSVVMLAIILLIVALVHRDKNQKEKLRFHSEYDPLTELPNRRSFEKIASQYFLSGKSGKTGKPFVLLFIDLDRFKEVNDTLGHDAGDALLSEAGRRLRHSLRKDDFAARIGGDEFAVLLSDIDEENIKKVAEKINLEMALPFMLGDQQAVISASIGGAFYPKDGETPEELLKNADIALYKTKEEGRNGYTIFGSETHRHVMTYPEATGKVETIS